MNAEERGHRKQEEPVPEESFGDTEIMKTR